MSEPTPRSLPAWTGNLLLSATTFCIFVAGWEAAVWAFGIPKIVLVELAFRAAWAEGAGAGTGAGVAVADLARFGALAGSLNSGTTSR